MVPDDLQQIADDYNYPIELIGEDKGQTFNQTNCNFSIGKIDMSKSYLKYMNSKGEVVKSYLTLPKRRNLNRKPKTHFKK